ncbi:hypothetical protein K458DRAFT_453618 [Lentithecium fluviatile CBS 122367]|uniref:Uncharacterized protein n=1 Tax=Lentithecium fluviatile CBS 122367 TaxID=1168545 RepID=A0A6G1IYU9_9PLEO|nr:hypothetical protein K458DRAFT_453618 [Lentithecium fluviatile CBS 122367]
MERFRIDGPLVPLQVQLRDQGVLSEVPRDHPSQAIQRESHRTPRRDVGCGRRNQKTITEDIEKRTKTCPGANELSLPTGRRSSSQETRPPPAVKSEVHSSYEASNQTQIGRSFSASLRRRRFVCTLYRQHCRFGREHKPGLWLEDPHLIVHELTIPTATNRIGRSFVVVTAMLPFHALLA